MDLSDSQKSLLDYWTQWRGRHGGLPGRNDMRVQDIGSHMAFVVIFDVLSDPLDYRYRLIGTMVREHSRADFTGKTLRQMEGKGPGSKIWGFLDQVRSEKEPLFREVPYVGPKELFLRSTLLFLPLASDHESPDKIFLVSHFISKNEPKHTRQSTSF